MTCIVGLVDGGVVYVGGDSAGVSGDDVMIRLDRKVFRLGEMVIGFTSSFRLGQVLRYSFVLPDVGLLDSLSYLSTVFVDECRRVFGEKGILSKDDEGMDRGGTFLLGFRGGLYYVASDFQVGEVEDGFYAVGCGAAYAIGALFASRGEGARERIFSALEAAARFSTGVRPPFVIESV